MSNRFAHRRGLVPMFLVLAAGTAVLSTPVANAATKEAQEAGRIDTRDFTVVPFKGNREALRIANLQAARESALVGVNQGSESEPNNTFGTADALTGTEGMIRGSHFSGPPTPGTDPDFYSFTVAGPAKVYAGTMTSSSGATDSVLEVLGTDGTTVIELDDQDGSGNSSSIAGATLPAAGTYFFRVTNFSMVAPISLYDLYFATRLQSTLPTPETEPNDNGTPQVIPASEYVSGVVNPVGDTDTFSFSALAGETIFLSLDLDPERDVTTFNGRIGIGLFGTPTNFLVSGDSGAFDTIDSEALMLTVKTAGTYQVFVDSQAAGGGGPTATYAFSVTHISPTAGSCTTYTNATPTALADVALTSSTIAIPDSRIIQSVKVNLNISHANIPDLDIHLRSPPGTAGNDNGLVSDIGTAAQTGPQDLTLDDEAAFPLAFTILNNLIFRPEATYRLDWFRGENSLGTWTLDIRDDLAANTGTLNSWSITICEDPALAGNLIDGEDFEANNGGYTSSGTANEWEWGTPATAQTGVAPFIAPFANCASGTGCWKTDLDNTYDPSSNQVLTSPAVVLGATAGTVTLTWQARYQMESASVDRAYVRVTEVGNPANTRIVWHAANQLMSETAGSGASLGNTPESAGWGRYRADISDFATLNVQVSFHLESDTSLNLGGFAIDDVEFRTTGTVPVELLEFTIE